MTWRQRRKVITALKYVLLVLVTLVVLFPLLWMVGSSLKTEPNLFAIPPSIIPHPVSLEGYERALGRPTFVTAMVNSITVAVGATALTLIVTVHGAYALARVRFFGRQLFAKFILCFYMVPAVLLIIPIYLIMRWLHLADSILGIMVIHTVINIPFCLWLLRAFFITVPAELEEAAIMDGCSVVGAFYRVIMPLSAPGIAAAGLFSFIVSWSEFLLAYVLVTSNASKTLPVILAEEIIGFEMRWQALLAMGVLVLVPVFVACLVFSRYLIEGLTAGAVRG